jgi:hypothetical protein
MWMKPRRQQRIPIKLHAVESLSGSAQLVQMARRGTVAGAARLLRDSEERGQREHAQALAVASSSRQY